MDAEERAFAEWRAAQKNKTTAGWFVALLAGVAAVVTWAGLPADGTTPKQPPAATYYEQRHAPPAHGLNRPTPPLTAENGSRYGDISRQTGRPKTVPVSGYYRKDGT